MTAGKTASCLPMKPAIILLSEDEPVIAQDISELLEHDGFQVVQADNPADFQALNRRWQPRLAILNFKQKAIPDGMNLACTVFFHLNMQVLFITGARIQDLQASPHFDARFEILHKPFTTSQLLRCLHKLTDPIS
jgi:DNA-binding response OmpR family regulator